MTTANDERPAAARFGAFGGVFTPCTLTILGVIMFLRFGHVVGQAGILHALAIVLAAEAITVLTSLSLSAIATNTRVRGGGAYYLISRSLGVEFGGAIGVVFFLAQAISVALYVIGFSEAFVDVLGPNPPSLTTVATVVNVAAFVCVFIGAGWAIKIQNFILVILGLSLVSFYTGALGAFDLATLEANLLPHYTEGQSFFTMFALFFPAVTGIMAGANMSGDLKDPARAIPLGTLAAVGVTALIYLTEGFLLGCARAYPDLIANNLVVKDIAWSPLLITAGIFAATLSSALGSMMGAPRILQAFGRDGVFPWLKRFGQGSGKTNEPRRATVLTFAISQACIALGDLNAIAPIISMAFMITYGTLNLATFYESITGNPSYRPRFRWCHWSTSLAGAAGCLVVMFLIDPVWAGVSIASMVLLHGYIRHKEVEARWGDLQSGLRFERVRTNLLKLEDSIGHPKNWRPVILALSGSGWSRPHLAIYGHWLTAGHGILSLGQVIQGDIDDRLERRNGQERVLRQFIRQEELEAFPAVVVAPYLSDGIESLVQCHGLGSLRPNTVLLGWPTDSERAEAFCATLRTVAGLQRNLVLVRFRDEPADVRVAPRGTLDVWWRGEKNGALMLLLAYLLTKNDEWRNRPIRLLRVIPSEAGRAEVLRHLSELIGAFRIEAAPVVIVAEDFQKTIQRESRFAALTFLGFQAPPEGEEAAFFLGVEQMAGPLGRVICVQSVGDILLDA